MKSFILRTPSPPLPPEIPAFLMFLTCSVLNSKNKKEK